MLTFVVKKIFLILTLTLIFSTSPVFAKSFKIEKASIIHEVTKDGCHYRVVIDKNKKINIFASGLKSPKPKNLILTLNKKDGKPKHINVRFLEEHDGLDVFQQDETIHGNSYIGLGVSFDINFGK